MQQQKTQNINVKYVDKKSNYKNLAGFALQFSAGIVEKLLHTQNLGKEANSLDVASTTYVYSLDQKWRKGNYLIINFKIEMDVLKKSWKLKNKIHTKKMKFRNHFKKMKF